MKLPAWSPYDAAAPHLTGVDLAERLAWRNRHLDERARRLSRVRDVIAVVSSSRGGSTMFTELLRRHGGLLHLPAEVNSLFAAAGLHCGAESLHLGAYFADQIGQPAPDVTPPGHQALVDEVTWRMAIQWPDAGVEAEEVASWASAAVERLAEHSPHGAVDAATVHLEVIRAAAARGTGVDLRYYDTAQVQATPPEGPPGARLLEMPPFVLARNWRWATDAELRLKPLVVSTPRNAFRLGYLRALFPRARFRVIHLTRNPAASINGLIDGWLHHGFFNLAVEEELQIAGYSDVGSDWARWWWCFDFPPVWRSLTRSPLVAVCAEQWHSHHDAVLRYVDSHLPAEDCLRLRFEDIRGEGRAAVLDLLEEWTEASGLKEACAAPVPVVMSTVPPRPGRWLGRQDVIRPQVEGGPVADLAAELGYRDPSLWV